jgi:hypothetical protein
MSNTTSLAQMESAKPRRATRAGRQSFADSQEKKILDLLIEAKSRGVSKKFLIFELGFTQCGARIHSLERRGHKIRHEMQSGDRYVTFVLESSPERETPLPTYAKNGPDAGQETLSRNWFEEATGSRVHLAKLQNYLSSRGCADEQAHSRWHGSVEV